MFVVASHTSAYAHAFRTGQSLAHPAPAVDPKAGLKRSEIMQAVGGGLLQVPYAERRAILNHLAPALAGHGLPQALITQFDPTDEALRRTIRSARLTGEILAGPQGETRT